MPENSGLIASDGDGDNGAAPRQLQIEILRCNPREPEDAPHFETFTVEEAEGLTLFIALNEFREEQDPSLQFDFVCRAGICGSCGMLINGRPGLACRTLTRDLGPRIRLAPLPGFELVGDLSVNTGRWMRALQERLETWVQRRTGSGPEDIDALEAPMEPALARELYEVDRCIECGCCIARCGTAQMHEDFIGAVGLNKLVRFRLDPRDTRSDDDFYALVGDEDGVFGCMSLLGCEDVCPKNLSLGTQIAFRRTPAWERFLRQFQDPMVIILLVTAAVVGVLTLLGQHMLPDAIVIFGVVLLNAVLGFVQEGKAEGALDALRKLGFAFREVAADTLDLRHADLSGMHFAGLQGIIDPPKASAIEAVAACRRAGIRTVMITGDHPQTAQAVARQLGIDAHTVLTGAEISELDPAQLKQTVERVSVYARVAPEHKKAIAEALQAIDHVVAMTGDGVNDAPALKAADIGVAMGRGGTEVAKEASDMVLEDDNFATIVAAIEEGRHAWNNLQKAILYTLPTNAAQALLIMGAIILVASVPLFAERFVLEPVQIL